MDITGRGDRPSRKFGPDAKPFKNRSSKTFRPEGGKKTFKEKNTGQLYSVDDDSEAVNQAAYSELVALTAAGKLKPVIQTVLPFDRIIEAHRIVDGGHKRGSVVVRVAAA